MTGTRWLIGAALIALVGCKSTGVDKTENALKTMKAATTGVADASTKIDGVVTAMTTLAAASGDMKGQYKALGDAITALKKQEAYLKDLRVEFQARKDAYLQSWNAEVQKITSEDMRERANERRTKAMKTFDELNASADAVRKEYDPWIARVTDVHTYLGHDLNPAGIKSVSKDIETVKDDAGDIKEELADLGKKMQEITANLEATRAEATPPAAK